MIIVLRKLKRIIISGNQRSVLLKKNILGSFAVKAISILIGYILVPLTLDYLDPTRYGIWITLSTFTGWIQFFEIGLGGGLQNKLAETLANSDDKLAKNYVSTTYAILTSIFIIVSLIFYLVNPLINWSKILNTDNNLNDLLFLVTTIVFTSFFIQFFLKLIVTVLYADQRPAIGNMLSTISNAISLIAIFVIVKTSESSLLYLAITLSIAPVLVYMLASIFFYNRRYKNIRPSIKNIDMKSAKDLMSLGFRFFIIRIASIVLFQTSNIIIAQFFGPKEVTPYSIAYKLFATINMIFSIVIMPFRSAYTDAWVKKDLIWIKKTHKKLLHIWRMMALLGVFLVLFSKQIFLFWVGNEVEISYKLSILIALYFILFTYGGVYNMFINGTSKITVQFISLIIGAFIFFPIAILFIKVLEMGIEGLVLAMIISNFYLPIIAPLQFRLILSGKARGIWNK